MTPRDYRRPLIALLAACAGVSILVGAALTWLGSTVRTDALSDGVVDSASTDRAMRELTEAQNASPYSILRPSWVPGGYVLTKVMWLDTPPTATNPGSFSVDLFYHNAAEEQIHIWQTNIPVAEIIAGGKDPVTDVAGVDVSITSLQSGREYTWTAADIDLPGRAVQMLSVRLDDGRTLSIDADLSPDDTSRVAESLMEPSD